VTARKAADIKGSQYLSVTSILDVLNKEALIPWAAGAVADVVVANPDYWAAEAKRDPVDCRTRLAAARFKPTGGRTLTAAKLGTQLHQAAENWAITGVRPKAVHAEVAPLLDQLEECFDLYKPEWVASEMIVINRSYGYAGQCDGIWKTHKGTFLIDFKSTPETHYKNGDPRTPYPEVSLQTTAYRHAEIIIPWSGYSRENKPGGRWYTIPDDAMARAIPMPEVDGTLAVHVTPAWANPHDLLSEDEEWNTFLHLLEVSRWVNGRGKNAVGPIMAPPGRGDMHMAEGLVA
jgi:hypothetical protein